MSHLMSFYLSHPIPSYRVTSLIFSHYIISSLITLYIILSCCNYFPFYLISSYLILSLLLSKPVPPCSIPINSPHFTSLHCILIIFSSFLSCIFSSLPIISPHISFLLLILYSLFLSLH